MRRRLVAIRYGARRRAALTRFRLSSVRRVLRADSGQLTTCGHVLDGHAILSGVVQADEVRFTGGGTFYMAGVLTVGQVTVDPGVVAKS